MKIKGEVPDLANAEAEPLIFRTPPRQRMLVALARLGPLRIGDAVRLSQGGFPDEQQIVNFERSGLVFRYGTDRARVIALNPKFPGFDRLLILLKAMPHEKLDKRLPTTSAPPQSAITDKFDAAELFGPRFATTALLAIAAAGGSIETANLRRLLRHDGAMSSHVRVALAEMTKRQVFVVNESITNLSPRIPHKRLVAFVTDFLREAGEEEQIRAGIRNQLKIIRSPVAFRRAPRLKKKKADAADKRRTEGLPHFLGGRGQRGRIRLLLALVANGSLGRSDLIRISKVSQSTVDQYIASHLVVRLTKPISKRRVASFAINPTIPAYTELCDLLRKMEERWPMHRGPQPTPLLAAQSDGFEAWTGASDRYFSSPCRTEVLLTIAAFGRIDARSLERAVPNHERDTILDAIDSFDLDGIIRLDRKEGTAKMYALNPEWFAADELRALLTRLVAMDSRYEGRNIAGWSLMARNRRAMTVNADKRERKKKELERRSEL